MAKTKFNDDDRFKLPYVHPSKHGENYLQRRFKQYAALQAADKERAEAIQAEQAKKVQPMRRTK